MIKETDGATLPEDAAAAAAAAVCAVLITDALICSTQRNPGRPAGSTPDRSSLPPRRRRAAAETAVPATGTTM